MYDFYRVTCAVPKVNVAGIEQNTQEIISKINDSKTLNTDFLLFPELCVTGYTCGDLFFQETLIADTISSIDKICAKSESCDSVIAIGAPLRYNGQLYNCGIVIYKGEIKGIVPKTFLPNYNEFYEKRWFSSSEDLSVSDVTLSELGFDNYDVVPIGRDIVFSIDNKIKFGVEICEDLWSPLPPSTFLTLNGAELILNLSASNETIAKRNYRKELVKQQSARNMCVYAYCSAGASESTSDIIFSGNSLIAENGAILKTNQALVDDDYMITTDFDLGKIKADRLKLKSFKDTARLYGSLESARDILIETQKFNKSMGQEYSFRKLPFVPSDKKDRLERCLNIFKMQVAGLKKRVEVTGSKMVLGISGGLDSTLALLVCAETARQLNVPLSNVVGITMPCFGTSDRTYNNSLELMKTLGVRCEEINIKKSCIQHFEDIGHDINVFDKTYENSQARERTQVLMDYASRVDGFVVGTGDLSELALGWCTYNGDHISMYGVNVSIPKTLVRWMIDALMDYNVFPKSTEVLRDILDTPISPELLPPDTKGNIAQKTESIIGPYALHDFFLYYVMRYGYEPEKIFHMASIAFKDDYDKATILKWLRSFYWRFFSQQFKRNCLPDGVKVGSICLSPRGDFRMPSDAVAKSWLDKVEKISS